MNEKIVWRMYLIAIVLLALVIWGSSLVRSRVSGDNGLVGEIRNGIDAATDENQRATEIIGRVERVANDIESDNINAVAGIRDAKSILKSAKERSNAQVSP